jgi:hypothetical protein
MTLEQLLRVSVIQAELRRLAERSTGAQARVLRYAAQVLSLLQTSA